LPPLKIRKRATVVTHDGISAATWWRVAASLALLAGAVWVAAPYFKPGGASLSQRILFLCLLALILYELAKVGRAGRVG
jgi:hypothetical protein